MSRAAEDTSQFLNAFHAAVLVNLQATIQSATAAFIQAEDIQQVMMIAARHQTVKQIHNFDIPRFQKSHDCGYQEDIRQARVLELIWAQLSEVADKIGGELAVSIPESWLEVWQQD